MIFAYLLVRSMYTFLFYAILIMFKSYFVHLNLKKLYIQLPPGLHKT
jgi:hypothetical protein